MVSGLLLLVMLPRFARSGKVMPAGLVVVSLSRGGPDVLGGLGKLTL